VAVVIPVAVAPTPVFLLFFRTQRVKNAIGITVVFAGPPMLIENCVLIPDVVVAVAAIIHPVVIMLGASHYTKMGT